MTFSNLCNEIFWKSTTDYHVTDSVDAPMNNPYELKTIEYYLYLKNWIDAVQWHFEDIIRDPQIDPVEALALKRRIDKSNQDRTDLVELIDSYFLDKYKEVKPLSDATINTESPAWAIDRLSILALKIYHMQQGGVGENRSLPVFSTYFPRRVAPRVPLAGVFFRFSFPQPRWRGFALMPPLRPTAGG